MNGTNSARRSLKRAQTAGLRALLTGEAPRLVAVVPAHNEAARIGATIRSLRDQNRHVDQMIVVCDNCTDETADIATLAGAEVVFTVGNTAKKAAP